VSRRVQLHFGDFVHPVYRDQLPAVPDGWSYAFTHPSLADHAAPTKKIIEKGSRLGAARAVAERVALRALSAGGYVHRVRVRPLADVSLIHSAERLLRNPPLPYVLDLEHADLFVLYQQASWQRPWTRAIVERALLDDRLRFLLPWSDAARRSVLTVVSPATAKALESKLRVVYPAVPLAADRPHRRSDGPLRLLFVGTHFYEKGGVDAVLALREARKTHDVELDIVTYAPPGWDDRMRREPGLRLHAPAGKDFIERLYSESDALLFPSHMDTYGVVVGEAMSHGLPVLAPRHLALTETIQDEVSGLLFPPENMLWRSDTRCEFPHTLPVPDSYLRALERPSEGFVRGIAQAIVRLAEDRGLHARLAEGAWESTRSGHLSIPHRRAQLGEIYDAAAA
jgi:glycosyltransferase involved in cell wall biosynthesis